MRSIRKWVTAVAALLLIDAAVAPASAAAMAPLERAPTALISVPRFDHVVIVVLENKRYDSVIGHPMTPWVSSVARRWANMTRFYAETHPSQPNYLALFSGSTQGVRDNNCPHNLGSRPNLARQLLDAGYTFTGYSEGLPHTGYRGCASGRYVRRHVPWVNFSNVPSSVHKPFTAFPSDFRKLPDVAFVIPDLCHDMHDCPKDQADRWLKRQFAPYISWAASHNSLFILTFDEDNRTDHNHIPTIIAGARVKPGQYSSRLDHYHLLRTIQAMYRLRPTGHSADRAALTSLWAH
ncbi:alkaline phosphatase family protein [Krasilnikovia sp. MM14-A1004]|uniref:alkaline phosphatase family protein n=1 Tax=Krasilnikovia sp. MM14-A1004 TaxID=3373541 RepID=UPI00399D4401